MRSIGGSSQSKKTKRRIPRWEIEKSLLRRIDKRSLPADDRVERRKYNILPIFLRRCVVRLHEKGKDLTASFAICTAVMKRAGYFVRGKGLRLSEKGKRRERVYKMQKDTPTQLSKFDSIMKSGDISKALLGALGVANSDNIEVLNDLGKLYEETQAVFILEGEQVDILSFAKCSNVLSILSEGGVFVEAKQMTSMRRYDIYSIDSSNFKRLERYLNESI